jgi:L-lysine 2,3-aminomutase
LRVAKNDALYRARNRDMVFEYLSKHPCVDCGESNPVVLEFDHVRGQKLSTVSKLKNSNTRWRKLLIEIEKCDVRCVNCHRRRTFEQFNYSR